MKQNNVKLPYTLVVGNEKGGAGKTTCSMHIIAGLLDEGFEVASIDVDCRQHSLTRYVQNRRDYIETHEAYNLSGPNHYLIEESRQEDPTTKAEEEKAQFEEVLAAAKKEADIIIIDSPGSYTNLSKIAHSYADTVVTPINDSFIDMDVLARVNGDTLEVESPSIYSQMIWEQKMEKAKRDKGSIDWIVLRNRLSNINANNKKKVADVLEKLSKRISFRVVPGFSERVIFRELFLQGLTLLDLRKIDYGKQFTVSHVSARQELREFLKSLQLDSLKELKNQRKREKFEEYSGRSAGRERYDESRTEKGPAKAPEYAE
jgi:chromosome partitioning protein